MLTKFIPNIINPGYWKKMWRDVSLVWWMLRDSRVPIYVKILPAVAVLYLLSPFDIIPGFLPIIGQLDDLGLLMLALGLFVRLAPREVVAEYEQKMRVVRHDER